MSIGQKKEFKLKTLSLFGVNVSIGMCYMFLIFVVAFYRIWYEDADGIFFSLCASVLAFFVGSCVSGAKDSFAKIRVLKSKFWDLVSKRFVSSLELATEIDKATKKDEKDNSSLIELSKQIEKALGALTANSDIISISSSNNRFYISTKAYDGVVEKIKKQSSQKFVKLASFLNDLIINGSTQERDDIQNGVAERIKKDGAASKLAVLNFNGNIFYANKGIYKLIANKY